MRNAKRVKAKCDNESVVKGYKRIREWEKNGKQDDFPKFNHSVYLWEEVKWWSAKWDGKFELEWHKGHPEERDPTRESWCISDWMNHVAHRLAEPEYGKAGGDDNPGCLAHQSNWKVDAQWEQSYLNDTWCSGSITEQNDDRTNGCRTRD